MARTCVVTFEGEGGESLPAGKTSWTLTEDSLSLAPEGSPPRVYPLREIRAITGDGYAVKLDLPGGCITLGRLGADGPGLLAEIRRLWLPARAKALRVEGRGEPSRFSCRFGDGASAGPCAALLYEDVLLVAPEGKDLRPVFLSLIDSVSFEEIPWAIHVKESDGPTLTFDKLAGRTGEFREALDGARANLAREASDVLAFHVPRLDAAGRAVLAGTWPPGRLLPLTRLEGSCPGFGEAVPKSWLKGLPRRKEAEAILRAAPPGETFLAFRRPGVLRQAPSEPDEGPSETTPDTPEPAPSAAIPEQDALLWLLARVKGTWLLEALSEPDHATYRFEGGEELPGLLSRLLCAPQFSVEAVYLPLDSLAGERSALSIPARELPFLRELRARFRGRILHLSFEKWSSSAWLGA